MSRGVVKWFDGKKGYGFIVPEDGKGDLFVHWKAIEGEGYKELTEGDKVEFEIETGDRGRKAVKVKKV